MVVLTTFPPPNEGIRHQQANTAVLINDRNLGKGTLYIAESRVSWVNASSGEGFSLEYPHICLHAISRTPIECLYMMLDTSVSPKLGIEDGSGDHEDGDGDDSDDDAEDENTVMKFLPDDTAALDAMYQAMSQCQALNPDPQESDSDPENIFLDADGDAAAEEGNHGEGECEEDYEYEEAGNGNGNGNGVSGQAVHDDEMEVDSAQFEDADSDIDN